jgi:hypothetical protein
MAGETRGLCFDGAVVNGNLASSPACVRVLGQSVSRGAAREYEAAQARWRAALGAARAVRTASGAEGPPPAWGRLATSLPSDAFATEEDVLRSLRKLLKLPAGEVRARACVRLRVRTPPQALTLARLSVPFLRRRAGRLESGAACGCARAPGRRGVHDRPGG